MKTGNQVSINVAENGYIVTVYSGAAGIKERTAVFINSDDMIVFLVDLFREESKNGEADVQD